MQDTTLEVTTKQLGLRGNPDGSYSLSVNGEPASHVDLISLASVDYTTGPAEGFYIVTDGSGAVKVDTVGGESGVVIPQYALPAGYPFPLRVTKVYKSGTTAAALLAMW